MKKILVMLAAFFWAGQLFAQTLFTYGRYAVSKDEFLRAYNKNKMPVTDKEKALRAYLELYYRFKLKVKAAEAQRLDTLQQLGYDMQNFSSQVAESYMNDEKELNKLVDEALLRSQKDIHVLHFYTGIKPGMASSDTLKAYKTMNELSSQLDATNTEGLQTAATISQKYPSIQQKDLGFITVFLLPYPIENRVYQLKPGQSTKPYRTKTALHIFKNVGERPGAGKWKIAQILLSAPPNASTGELKAIGARADSIYNVLIAGADFAALARQYSEDKLTYLNGGELPEFGSGKYELPFETSVFGLKQDGEISKPIFTGYGYHIVKRLQQQAPPADKNDEAFRYELKQKIMKDPRMDMVRANFLKTVKNTTGYKKNPAISDVDLFRYADSVSSTNRIGNYPINNKTIFSFTKLSVKGVDWLNFIKDYKLNPDVYKGESNPELLDKYIANSCNGYYRRHLEDYNPEFKLQMQEFREGNMLFEIMERNVWGKATEDSIGLKKYYNAHKATYQWGASASILLFNCSDSTVANAAATVLANGKNWKQIMENNEGKLQADSGRYELTQLQLPTGSIVAEGLISKPLLNSNDNTASFVKILKIFPANEQRTYEEARGLVINDYQNFLEEQWVASLKKGYPLKLNEAVFQSLLK